MEYHDQDFITKDIKTIPGFNYIQQVHSETEQKLKRELPKSFPLSLWMTTFSVSDESRQELIIPENPLEEAIYWLGFNPGNSYNLRDSLLVRITDKPQCILGISEHPNIKNMARELRKAYNNKPVRRTAETLKIPSRDWAQYKSFTHEPSQIGVYLIFPENNLNIAHDFEDIFRRYNALEMILEKGYKYSYERSEEELLTFFALT